MWTCFLMVCAIAAVVLQYQQYDAPESVTNDTSDDGSTMYMYFASLED